MTTTSFLHKRFNPESLPSPIVVKEFNRRNIAKLFAELGYKKGAEIGVDAGRYSQILCQEIPDLELWCIDPWKPLRDYSDPDTGKKWGEQKESRTLRNMERTKTRLDGYNVHLIRGTSMEVVKDFDIDLDFVYIDANHNFPYVMEDLINWGRKVRKGGMMAGHDYADRFRGNKIAVNAYAEYHQFEWFLNSDKSASYFWAK
jgi:hypothetical protein